MALDTERSSYREALIEHLFLGELLRELWRSGRTAEVMKPQPDHGGYDLVIDCEGIVRHVQVKSSSVGAKASFQKVHMKLAGKPSGCIVWVVFERDSLAIKRYLWFGGEPGQRLPDISGFKMAKHTKANMSGVKALRPALRQVPKSRFREVSSIRSLTQLMFGSPPGKGPVDAA